MTPTLIKRASKTPATVSEPHDSSIYTLSKYTLSMYTLSMYSYTLSMGTMQCNSKYMNISYTYSLYTFVPGNRLRCSLNLFLGYFGKIWLVAFPCYP